MSPKLKKFFQSWLINTLAVAIVVNVVPGIHSEKPVHWVVASLLLGILNAFLRPILLLLALPLLIFSLGLFILVINALLLYFVGILLKPHFYVDTFWSAFWGALVISIVSILLNSITGTGNSRIQVRRGPPPSNPGPGGDGPVIDV
jgi:putative membrane protein